MNGTLSLAQRYLAVMARIRKAAEAAGRDPAGVRLLAVGKAFPAGSIAELHSAGQSAFGESYLQEALVKMAALANPGSRQPTGVRQADSPERQPSGAAACLEWHFIGPIQSNKTRKLAQAFDWVQSVADERTARRLCEQRPDHLAPLQVCLQVNVSGESSKSGCHPGEVQALALVVAQLPRLRLRGLMAIPEPSDDTALQAARFGQLRTLFEGVRGILPLPETGDNGLDTLSMGMSADLEVAVAQGATMVRIGAALFGTRPGSA